MITRIAGGACLIVFTYCGAFAQSAAPRPEFEVASVKPSKPAVDGRLMIRLGGDPGRIDYTNMSLKMLITRAYGVKDYQVNGPGWLDTERFDVTATHPPNTPREQVQAMLQTLLEDRFKMTVHKEKRVLPAYALTLAKGGAKFQAVPPEPGEDGKGRPGGMMRVGRGHLEATKVPMSQVADMLTNILARPVVDSTGIEGVFDFKLDYTPDENTPGMAMKLGLALGPRPEGGGGEPGHEAGAPDAPNIFAALQEKLGLKLETQKLPVDIIVIDKAERVPTEN
jgi:uncharacterized protein (TIGR03435 family)